MRTMNAYRGVCNVLAMSALILSGCPTDEPDPSIECGPNTEQVDGKCVSTVDEAPCGEGTSRDPDSGQCEPDVACGPGTTYSADTRECEPDSRCGPGTTWNAATGECEPDVVCGDNTTFDPDTGACLPDVFCGDGTHVDEASGECVPNETCGPGTVYDTALGACVPELVCGPGLTAVDGVCLSAIDLIVAEQDLAETVPDVNDPLLGGAAESIVLEAVGERAVLTGTIARPVDLDGDTVIDQDRDVWRFSGSAGQMLRIRVVSTGAFQPAFTLTGPNEYYREPQLGFAVDAEREVVLPYDGDYDLTVLPSLALQGSEPIGGNDAVYAVIIEEQAWPTPVALPLSESGEVALASGTTLNLQDNFFALQASGSTPLRVGLTAPAGGTEPVLLLFTAAGELRGEIPVGSSQDMVTANAVSFFSAELGLVAVVDWQTSNGVDVDFELSANPIETQVLGELPVDGKAVLPAPFIPGNGGLSFTFDATQGQVIVTDFLGIDVDLLLIAPSGSVVFSGADPSFGNFFLAQETGTYWWVMLNQDGTDETPSIHLASYTPHDAGSFDGVTAGSASFSGDLLKTEQRPSGAFVLVENAGPALLEVDFDWTYGMPDLEVYELDERGVVGERRVQTWNEPRTVRSLRETAGRSLVRLGSGDLGDTPDPWVADWRVDLRISPIPTASEVEPNDTMETTQAISGAPLRLLGNIANDEIDIYTFSLDGELAANEMLVIDAETLDRVSAIQMRIRAPGSSLEADPLKSVTTGAPLTRLYMFADDVTGPFVIELEGTSNDGQHYFLELKRVTVPVAEAEPNDTTGDPQSFGTVTLPDLPLRAFGTVSTTEKDVYQLAFDEALPAGSALSVRVENPTNGTDELHLTVYDQADVELANGENSHVVLLTPVTSTAPLFIEVVGDEADAYPYRLIIDVLDGVEAEPNDTIAVASVLPTLAPGESTTVWATDRRNQVDVFAIHVDPPLAAGEGIAIHWRNAHDEGELQVTAMDSTGAEILVSETWADEMFIAPVAETGPFYVEVIPQDSSWSVYPELYQLRVARISDVTVDLEPNDDIANAQALELPADIVGSFYDDDADVFAITLDADLAPGEKLIIDGAVRYTDDFVEVAVLDSAGLELVSTTDLAPYLEFEPPVTAAGTTYWVSIVAAASLSPDERYAYDLHVDIAVP